MLSASALLDELMGADRDLAPDQKRKSTHWSDPQVCKYHLCGFCPSELFINTRSDLGPCEKLHDDKLKAAYEKSSRQGQMGYEEDFLRYLQSIMTDVERRIRRGHARLIPREKEPPAVKVDNEKEEMLTQKINTLIEQVEQLGSEGKVEEAQGVMKLIEQLKEEKEQLNGRGRDTNHMTSQEKQMEVCEVCGAFLIVGDAQTRVDDHLQGKQHMGYAKIKSTLEEFRTRPWRNLRNKDKDQEKEKEQEKDGERDRDRDHDRDRDRNRDRDRDRERRRDRDRDRGRDHDRDRDRRRDRDRDRDRDSDRDRRRDRDRDGNRGESSSRDSKRDDKDKSRRSRSRSRERSNKEDRDKDKESEKQRSSSPRRSRSPH